MKRILGACAAAALSVTMLAGCGDDGGDGGGSGGGYCEDIKATKANVQALDDQDISQATFDKLTASIHTIADEAPSDIQDDWNTVGDALDSFNAALDDAGISFDDLENLGKPGGPTVDPSDVAALTTAAQALDAEAISTAGDNINKQVKADCGFELDFGN